MACKNFFDCNCEMHKSGHYRVHYVLIMDTSLGIILCVYVMVSSTGVSQKYCRSRKKMPCSQLLSICSFQETKLIGKNAQYKVCHHKGAAELSVMTRNQS